MCYKWGWGWLVLVLVIVFGVFDVYVGFVEY